MATFRIRAEIVVDTAAHAQTIANAIQQQLGTRAVFRTESLVTTADDSGRPIVLLDARLTVRADRDSLREWLRDQVQNHPQVKIWIRRALLLVYLCRDDEPEPASPWAFGLTYDEHVARMAAYQAWQAGRDISNRELVRWEVNRG